jgi:hypothetical protein
MSHFTTLQTQITDTDALVKALADLGFDRVEVNATAQHLYGYQGDHRPETAEVVIRREHIGRMSNDIGFKRLADGSFEAIISEYDRKKYSRQWLDRLTQRYAYHTALAKLAEQGFTLNTEEVLQGGEIHMVLRRMT